MMDIETLQAALHDHDGGVLKHGTHSVESREFCALEFSSIVREKPFSDSPTDLPDLRPLNDGPWSSDQARTDALVPVMVALWDWSEWTPARQQQWSARVAIATVNQIIAELPGLNDDICRQCREATTL